MRRIRHLPAAFAEALAERLAFERAAVALYDAFVLQLETSNDDRLLRVVPVLRVNRDEERLHERWLEARIAELGADAYAITDMARVVSIEAAGIAHIVLDSDDDPRHLFHALHAAEVADAAGWEVLVALADEVGDRRARRAFARRLDVERAHVAFVRRTLVHFAYERVLGFGLISPPADS